MEDSGDEQVDAAKPANTTTTSTLNRKERSGLDFIANDFLVAETKTPKFYKKHPRACAIRHCGCGATCGAYFPNPFKQKLNAEERVQEQERLNKWISVCLRDDAWIPAEIDRLGWEHFDPQDVTTSHRMRFGKEEVLNRLRKGAVPSRGRIEKPPKDPVKRRNQHSTMNDDDKNDVAVKTTTKKQSKKVAAPVKKAITRFMTKKERTYAKRFNTILKNKQLGINTESWKRRQAKKKRDMKNFLETNNILLQPEYFKNKNMPVKATTKRRKKQSDAAAEKEEKEKNSSVSAPLFPATILFSGKKRVKKLLPNGDPATLYESDSYAIPNPTTGRGRVMKNTNERIATVRRALQSMKPDDISWRKLSDATNIPKVSAVRIVRDVFGEEFPEHVHALSKNNFQEKILQRRVERRREHEKKLRQKNPQALLTNGIGDASVSAVLYSLPPAVSSTAIGQCSANIQFSLPNATSLSLNRSRIDAAHRDDIGANSASCRQCNQLQSKLAAAQRALTRCKSQLQQVLEENRLLRSGGSAREAEQAASALFRRTMQTTTMLTNGGDAEPAAAVSSASSFRQVPWINGKRI